MARRLKRSGRKSRYISRLQQRIKAVCLGHIKWLEALVLEKEFGCFVADYWVTGKIMPKISEAWQPRDSITDTPFQIIKICDFHGLYSNEDDKDCVRPLLGRVWRSWLQELDKLDKRASYAWSHARDEGIDTFRLDDHFWLWKALKSLEDMGLWKFHPSSNPNGDGTTQSRAVETKHPVAQPPSQDEFASIA